MGKDTAAMICADVPEALRERAEELARNVLALERKLEEARKQADDEPLTIKYERGGMHKNPFWDSYAQLFNAFSRGISQLSALVNADGNAKPAAQSKLAELRVIAGDLKKAQ